MSDSTGTSPAWEEPIPLAQIEVPPFPTAALPGWLRDFVDAEAVATQTPADLPALLGLSACSFACSKKAVVRVRPGHEEQLNLFAVVALPPANRKSAVFRDTIRPLEEAERAEVLRSAPEVAHSQSMYRVAQEALHKAEVRAAKDLDAPGVVEEVARLAEDLQALRSKVPPRFVVDDCSPERLATLLAEHSGRIAVFAPEGDVFDLMAGRYSASGSANFGVFLKGHAGDDIRVDRVGRPSDYVSRPALTVGLAVQPEVIRGLMQKPGFLGRGLLARFLYGMPVSLLGRREIGAAPVPEHVAEAYRERLLALMAIPIRTDAQGEAAPRILQLEPDALERLEQFEAWLEPQLGTFGELGHMSDWAGKLVGAIVRIVGILRMGEQPENAEFEGGWITRDQVERGIEIGHYLIPHARAAYGEMGGDPAVSEAAYVLEWIRGQGKESFTKRDIFNALRGRFKKVVLMEPALSLLTEHGFIRARSEEPTQGPGRKPSPTYEVNPAVCAQNSHNAQNAILEAFGANSAHSALDWAGESAAVANGSAVRR